jgi:copper chaperone CopZ
MEDVQLLIPSIGCQGCMKKIVTKLQALPGVEIMQTDVPGKSLKLRYAASEISSDQIAQAIHEIGHRIANVTADEHIG